MKERRLLSAVGCVVGTVLLATTVVQAGHIEILVDTRGGVEVWSIPQHESSTEGFDATKIVLRGVAEDSKLVTFENIAFAGDLVQAWLPGSFGGPPQPTTWVGIAPAWAVIPDSWKAADSHINITSAMVGGGAGGSHGGLVETNDLSDPGGLAANLPLLGGAATAVTGIGGIRMGAPTDAFFLDTQFQTREVDLAYLVAPSGGAAGLTIGVLGEGITNSGDPNGAQWGFAAEAPLPIPFVAEVFCISAETDPLCVPLLTPSDGISGGQSDGTNFNVGVAGTSGGVNNWPGGESPDHAIDGVGQKYLNFGETDTGFVVTPASGPTTVGGIRLWTANDAEPRDPTGFEVWGTNADVSGDSIPLSDFTEIARGALDLPSSRNDGGGAALVDSNSDTVRLSSRP